MNALEKVEQWFIDREIKDRGNIYENPVRR